MQVIGSGELDVGAWGLQSTDWIVLFAGWGNVLGDHFLTERHCKEEMNFLPAAFFLEMQFFSPFTLPLCEITAKNSGGEHLE